MYLNCKSVRGPREEGRGRNVYYYSFFQLAFASWPSSYRRTSFFLLLSSFPRLMSAAAADDDNNDRSVQLANGMPKIPTLSLSLSLSQTQIHNSLPLPENASIITPGGYRLQPVQYLVLLLLLIRYCRSVRHEMLTPITYGYEKGSTSGNEIFRSLVFLLPCPLSLVLFLFPFPFLLIRIRLRADALELGRVFFSCCGVCVCVCVFEKG